MDWPQQFEIIEKILAARLAKDGVKYTLANAAELLDVKIPKLQAWKRGQRPTTEDLERLALRLDLSPAWLLLGAGLPTVDADGARLVPEYVSIGDTLHDLVAQLPAELPEIAQVAGMSPDELRACMGSRALPSALAVARMIHAYKVNGNFLLAQVGQPFLTDEQYEERGPLTWLREKRGDFDEPDLSPETVSLMAARMATVEKTMAETGVPRLDILRALRAMLDTEITKLTNPTDRLKAAGGGD
jgi:transcriptional regulator with XRE-family HTH domain